MYALPTILIIGIALVVKLIFNSKWQYFFAISASAILITGIIVGIDYMSQTTATEIWSGKVVDWRHEEAWDEVKTETTTDSQGNTTTNTYTIHHEAENSIKTTDDGWISVHYSPDGKRFDDNWPRTVDVIKKYWPEGTPSASTHTYENKVQASYSTFRHKDIDLRKYSDLPKYPSEAKGYIHIDRIIGNVPNKEQTLKKLEDWNTELNKPVPNPEKPGKTKSWKEVNLIFVNVGENKTQDYGYALQDYWQGGNKNDFVVAFSLDKDGNFNWVYPFSWSEAEILKLDVRDKLMDMKNIKDFAPIIDDVSKMVADKFVRKQFADFNYLQIDVSKSAIIGIWIVDFVLLASYIFVAKEDMLF